MGVDDSLNAPGSALANGAAAHALDFDDNCYSGVVHGSAVVFPAVLAMAQHQGVSGAMLLESFIAGLEVVFALGSALTLEFYEKGWWTTSVLGAIGAAAGASHAASFDEDATARAIAFAAAGAGGVRAVRGTTAKHLYCGRAAECGIQVASLAARGKTAPINVFEDRNGFVRVLGDSVINEEPLHLLGRQFALEKPGIDIKRFPICYAGHAAAEAAEIIMDTHKLPIDCIERVVCVVPPIVTSNLTYPRPQTVAEAQFSLEFAIAAILQFGEISLAHLTCETLHHEGLQMIMDKIEIKVREEPTPKQAKTDYCPEWASVTLTTRSGDSYSRFVGLPKGSARNPISGDALQAKFVDCATRVIESEQASLVLDSLHNIQSITDVRELYK